MSLKRSEFAVRLWGTRGSVPAPETPEEVHKNSFDLVADFYRMILTDPEVLAQHQKLLAALSAGDAEQPAASKRRQQPSVALDRYDSAIKDMVSRFFSTVPAWRNFGYGGDTSCVEIEGADEVLIIDAGTGIRRLGNRLLEPSGGGSKKMTAAHESTPSTAAASASSEMNIHILFTHFHWDHIMGLPFFAPIFMRHHAIHFYAVQKDLESRVRAVFEKPFFPVPFEELGAKVYFHQLEPRKPTLIAGVEVTPFMLDHPDPCWGYRVSAETTAGKKSYAHCVDTEAVRVSREELGADVGLYANADLCYFDAQFTAPELLKHLTWGHSTSSVGIEIALREGVREIIFSHHDPSATNQRIDEARQQTESFLLAYNAEARESGGRTLPTLKWSFARDGDRIVLGERLG